MRQLLVLFLSFFLMLLARGEEPSLLQPRRKASERVLEPKRKNTESTGPAQRPGSSGHQSEQNEKEAHRWDLHLFLGTPLSTPSPLEQSFSTLAFGALLSVPIMELNEGLLLYGSGGLSITRSGLTLAQPSVSFSHCYFHLPLLFKLGWELNEEVTLEGFAGLVLRPWEYDSRPTADGGFQGTSTTSKLQPEIGIGALYAFSESFGAKLAVSYLWITGGVVLFL